MPSLSPLAQLRFGTAELLRGHKFPVTPGEVASSVAVSMKRGWLLALLLTACSGDPSSQGVAINGTQARARTTGGFGGYGTMTRVAVGGGTSKSGETSNTPPDTIKAMGGSTAESGETTGGSPAGGESARQPDTRVDATGGTSAEGTGGTTTVSSTEATEGGQGNGGESCSGCMPLEFVMAPTLTPNDNIAAPLAAVVHVETNVPVTASVLVSGGDEAWTLSLDTSAVTHRQIILGVKPDTEYQVTVTVTTGDAVLVGAPLVWRTPALPADFPHLQLVQADPARMEPGMTMFDVRSEHYLVIVDNEGQVRWYYYTELVSDRFRLLANGNIIYISPDAYITEIDWLGNHAATWFAANLETPPIGTIPVSVKGFHHNLHEMPNGNILTLCRESRVVSNFPTSANNPDAPTTTTSINGDQVVEFTRAGDIVKRFSLFDLIDTNRVGRDVEGSIDWTHSNAVIYDVASDAYLVSIRHQDAVIKIRRDTGTLVWILGNHANWGQAWQDKLLTPLDDDFVWQYHQHAVELTPGGVGLFDNGNFRAPAYATPKFPYYSRAVRFVVDEKAMTVAQAWTYQPMYGNTALYSSAMSDADWQPNGNVLVAAGTLVSTREPFGWAQIVEVTAEGQTVFELDVLDSPVGTTFDADRIPDIRSMKVN